MEIKVKQKFTNKYRQGHPLIMKEAIIDVRDCNDGDILELTDERGVFLAKGYVGRQNKGYGWLLTWDKNEQIDGKFFDKKIKSAIGYRDKLYQDESTNAFRVFNGEGDGIGGLTIDYYDGYYVIHFYSEGIYKFREYVVEALINLDGLKAIYEKKRFDKGGKYIEDDEFVWGERGDFPIVVKENGVNYAVYLNEGAMTGIFTDQREVRKRIRDTYAQGKSILNTFSYTGAFSVAAAAGKAKKTTSVDLAKRSLELTREQFSVNGFDYGEHDIVVMDVFDYFKYANRKGFKFDVTILDPPSFARSKKRRFSAANDYSNLLKEAISVTHRGGVIIASTNCAGFDMKKFKMFIDKAFRDSKHKYKIIEEHSLPYDYKVNKNFPEGNYLKVVFIRKD